LDDVGATGGLLTMLMTGVNWRLHPHVKRRFNYGFGQHFRGGHTVVNHSAKEYVRGPAHTNTAESFFSLLKRGVYGSFHHVSRKHLHRYAHEFAFRWNLRHVTDGERTEFAVAGFEGKRLMYRDSLNTGR